MPRIVVLYTRALFGQGVESLLSREPGMDWYCKMMAPSLLRTAWQV